MSMSAFAQRKDGGAAAALESQQAKLLESLSAAEGEPVSYGELQEAGIELPASVVSELELAGVPIVRCSLGETRGAGVRLERAFDARGILARTAEATSSPAADAFAGERARERLVRFAGNAVGRACAAVGTVIAWAICVGPPAARYAGRWLLSTARAASERARRLAQHASSAGARRLRKAAVALSAWCARVLLPATRRTVERLAQLAHERAGNGGERAERWGRAACAALARAAGGVPPGLRAAGRWLATTSQDAAAQVRGSIADMRADQTVLEHPSHHARQQSRSAYRQQTPLDAAATLRPLANHQTRNRCVAFSALTCVFCVVLAVILSNLSASAGDTQRPPARHHHSRLALPNAARRAQAAPTSSTRK